MKIRVILNVVRMLAEYKNIVAEITEEFIIHKNQLCLKPQNH